MLSHQDILGAGFPTSRARLVHRESGSSPAKSFALVPRRGLSASKSFSSKTFLVSATRDPSCSRGAPLRLSSPHEKLSQSFSSWTRKKFPFGNLLVPRRGLEPPRIAPPVPKTGAFTNYATWANIKNLTTMLAPILAMIFEIDEHICNLPEVGPCFKQNFLYIFYITNIATNTKKRSATQ